MLGKVLLAAALMVGPAAAATVTAQFDGVITQGADFVDYFGAGQDLAGQAVSLTFVYDTDVGSVWTDLHHEVFHGPISAAVEVDGVTYYIPADGQDVVYFDNFYSVTHIDYRAIDLGGAMADLYCQVPGSPGVPPVDAPFSLEGTEGTCRLTFQVGDDITFFASFGMLAAPVPLPASRLLLLAGLCGFGIARRVTLSAARSPA